MSGLALAAANDGALRRELNERLAEYGITVTSMGTQSRMLDCQAPAAPSAALAAYRCSIADAAEARRFFSGVAQRLYLRVTPVAGAGNGAAPPSIEVDDLQVTIDYALP